MLMPSVSLIDYRTVATIRKEVLTQDGRNVESQLSRVKDDEDGTTPWRQDPNRMLQIIAVSWTNLAWRSLRASPSDGVSK